MTNEKNVKTVSIEIEPVYLTKHLLQLYIERHVEGKTTIKRQYALYEYLLQTMTYDDFVNVINQYIADSDIEVLTFAEWEVDCKAILGIIEETDGFKKVYGKFADMKL